MNFRLDQVSTIASLLQFNSSIMHFSFEGVRSLKKGDPACTQAVQGQPVYVLRQKTLCLHTYVTASKTTRVHPQNLGKN
jgi:hypothetical protein